VVLVGCYRVPSDLSCKIACEQGCPSGMTCIDGYCTSGDACDCGGLGKACCTRAASCATGSYCSAGTCLSCVSEVALGRRHSCIIEHDGTVWCAGNNDSQQLGNAGPASDTFVQVSDAAGPITDATAVAAGRTHSCALRAGGHVWCWGGNGEGELGDGTFTNSSTAVAVMTDTGQQLADAVELGIDQQFSCARVSGGEVRCWGRNDYGQLGDGTLTVHEHAVQVWAGTQALTGATSLSVGGDHACAIVNGQPWCWGANGDGRNGDGTTTNSGEPVMFGSSSALAVAAGKLHSCALSTDGTIECAGSAWMNRLGDGRPMTNSSTPVTVLAAPNGAPFARARTIAAGGVSCVVDTAGAVACWGNSPHGQTGDDGGSEFPSPVALPITADRVIAHWAHACAHGTDGSWWCWGRDEQGELGDGAHANVVQPIELAASCN
jgi:alpha-tubulin suppressor-like RCC1 family protein